MKFDHMVKFNGTYYEAGEEVPMKDKTETALETEDKADKTETKKK